MAGILCAPIFAGAAAGVPSIGDESILGTNAAYWRIGADGFTYRNGVRSYSWLNPQSGMDQFEVRAALVGDAPNVNAGLGVWLAAIGAPQWGYTGGGVHAGTLTVEIRQNGGAVLDTATIELETSGGGGGGGVPTYPPRPREADSSV